MSYEVLARRWRPQTFEEVSGQGHATTTLRNAIRLGRVPHAILLAGPRGVGKTTIARILARCLNCDRGPTETPCGECSACREIAAGTSLDVQEIDAASNTGVENVRDIRESVRYAAAPGKHRIFIIDEVHMLSQAAFNALLKTLEEPPARSLFVFATTDPQKMPETVLSRVQRFDLRRLPASEIGARLRTIAAGEGIELPEPVLRALAREGDGSLRDAEMLLDRLVGALGTRIELEAANAILDVVDRRLVTAVVDPVLARDPKTALQALRRALELGADPARLSAALLAELRDLLVARIVDEPAALLDATPEEAAQTQERASPHDPDALERLFRVLLLRHPDLAWAPEPAHALEASVVRLATLPTTQGLAELIERIDALAAEAAASAGAPSAPAGGTAAGGPPRPVTRPGPGPAPPAAPPTARAAARDPERIAALKQEAKSHPAVHEVVEALDAELREVRVRGDRASRDDRAAGDEPELDG